jgi:hypothetical protein
MQPGKPKLLPLGHPAARPAPARATGGWFPLGMFLSHHDGGGVGVSPAGFGILPKQTSRREPSDMDRARRVSARERANQSYQVRDRETRSPAGETPTQRQRMPTIVARVQMIMPLARRMRAREGTLFIAMPDWPSAESQGYCQERCGRTDSAGDGALRKYLAGADECDTVSVLN